MMTGLPMLTNPNARPSVRVAQSVASVLPMLLLAHPMLVSPMLFGETLRATADLKAGVTGDITQTGSFLLTATYFPALFVPALLTYLIAWPQIGKRVALILLPLVALVLLSFVSSLWSLSPKDSLLKSTQQAIVFAIAILPVLVVRDPARLLRPIFWLMAVTLVANLYQVAIRPPGPIGHEGIYEHKNILGGFCVFFVLFGGLGLVSKGILTKSVGLFLIVGGLVALVASNSKTALGLLALAPFAALVLYFAARWFRVAPAASLVAGVFIAIATFLVGRVVFDVHNTDILEAVFKDATFTGRTFIWEFTWNHILARPWLGYGYQGFWNIGADSPRFKADMSFIANLLHSHNGYLQVWLELGIGGLFLLFAMIWSVLGTTIRLVRFHAGYALFAMSILFYVVFNNTMETDWLSSTPVGTIMFLLIGLTAAMPMGEAHRVASKSPALHRPLANPAAPVEATAAYYAYRPKGSS